MHHVLTATAKSPRLPRLAFTLAELLVALTIVGVLGLMFTRILVSQARFTDQQNALRGARTVSRQAMNILESELRMVQDSGGIDSVSTDGKAIRVLAPYRFGLNCGVSKGSSVVSMLPVDSLSLAQAKYAGFAWRNHQGEYQIIHPPAPHSADAPAPSADAKQCTGSGSTEARIKTVSLNGRTGAVVDVKPQQPQAPVGQAVFFFQRITYTFEPSTAYPGQLGLFRSVQGGPRDELMAPFDSAARFKYWTRGATSSVSAPPALGLIRGIDVVFAARSSYTPMGKTAPSKSTVVASIFFRNVRSN